MGDTFNMPFKIAVLLESLKHAGELFDGIDSGSRDHDIIATHFQRLSNALMAEIEKVPME